MLCTKGRGYSIKPIKSPAHISGVDARTFNFPLTFAALFNVVAPDTFNVDINVEGVLKLTVDGGFNIALKFKIS